MPKGITKSEPGYYTPREAMMRLGISDRDYFHIIRRKYEKTGQLTPWKPSGVTMFPIPQIDTIADELVADDLDFVEKSKRPLPTTFAQATFYDIPGLTAVLTSFGWQATPVRQRESWYSVNDRIDYIVRYRSLILGYVNIVPYPPDVLEEMMSGRMRGWDIRPRHILPFEPGHSYDCFAGIAVRNVPHKEYYARHLINGFVDTLCTMATQERIIIAHLYATSSEEEGEQLSQDLGFIRQPRVEGDLFNRFVLDMEMAQSDLVIKYRETVKQVRR